MAALHTAAQMPFSSLSYHPSPSTNPHHPPLSNRSASLPTTSRSCGAQLPTPPLPPRASSHRPRTPPQPQPLQPATPAHWQQQPAAAAPRTCLLRTVAALR